jgi:hypothetical protein
MYIVFMARDQREVFIWTSVYFGLQNLPWDFHLRENGVHLKNTFPSHGMPPALNAQIGLSQRQIEWFLTKTKEAIFIYNILDSFHYRWP